MDEQYVSVIAMFISGICFAATIDIWRLMDRKLRYHYVRKRLFLVIELSIWLLGGMLTFYLLFFIKGGIWRFIDPLAQLIGFYFYEFALQSSIRTILRVVFYLFIRPLYRTIQIIFRIILAPIKFLMKWLFKNDTNG